MGRYLKPRARGRSNIRRMRSGKDPDQASPLTLRMKIAVWEQTGYSRGRGVFRSQRGKRRVISEGKGY